MMLGTPQYMAPEQWRGADPSPRSDIYSFGAIFFELLTGQILFQAKTIPALMHKHLTEAPPRLRDLRTDASEPLEQLLQQLLSKEPDERPESAAEVVRRLRELERELEDPLRNNLPFLTTAESDSSEVPTVIHDSISLEQQADERGGELPVTVIDQRLAPQQHELRPSGAAHTRKIRIYDLATELKMESKRLIEEVRREGVDVSVPSNTISKELAEKIRNKYFPKKETEVKRNIRVSEKALTDFDFAALLNQYEQEQAAYQEDRKGGTLKNLEEGIIVEGEITNVVDYGAFVDLGGIDGLLHVTDMSWGRLQNPGDIFKVGDIVRVKVLKFDRDRERISLGYKQLLPDPWESVIERFPMGKRVQGKVVSVNDYGAFIELEAGVEGLVHVSEMTWSKRMKHPSKLVQPGEMVDVEVLGVDPKNRRISLGMKQTLPNPWETLPERFRVGDRVRGRIRNLTDFGAFVEVEDGVDGLVHVSDISWNKRIKHPGEMLKKGQEIEAVIANIDIENRRLSLSIKDTEPSAWDKFVNEHKPGDIVHGKVTRFANFGVFVELADGLEGLCHVSELSDERVERPEDAAQIGQEMDFRILRIEPESKKIGLSHRAAKSA